MLSKITVSLINGYKKHKIAIVASCVIIGVTTTFYLLESKYKFMSQLAEIFIIGMLTWFAILAVKGIETLVVNKSPKVASDRLMAQRITTQASMVVRLVTSLLVIMGLALALMTFPQVRKVGISILASAGVVGLVLGVAAQKSLGNILSGLQVIFAQLIKIGDVVVADGESGVVEEVTFTRVVICTSDKRRVIVPTTYFMEKIFQNWTMHSTDLVALISLELDYTASLVKIREALDGILDSTALWDGRVKKVEAVDNENRCLKVKISVSALNPSDAYSLECYVREKLVEYLLNECPEYLPKLRIANL